MASFKTTKKHHKHLNNPFPSKPKTLPLIKGTLLFDPKTLPSHQVYDIGHDFQLNWSSNNGGSLSISHKLNLSRSIWSTVPGRAFVSAAVADTEVEESRGSFVIKDRNIRHVCNHQTIDEISAIQDSDLASGSCGHQGSPLLLIKGRILGGKGRKREVESLELVEKKAAAYAKYWMVFDQRNSDQVGFRVRFGRPDSGQQLKLSPRSYGYRGFARKMGRIRRLRVGWSAYISRRRVVVQFSPTELIEHYTEAIGRPQQLPEWIISGAVVGLQGGTDVVHDIWEQLKAKDTPIY